MMGIIIHQSFVITLLTIVGSTKGAKYVIAFPKSNMNPALSITTGNITGWVAVQPGIFYDVQANSRITHEIDDSYSTLIGSEDKSITVEGENVNIYGFVGRSVFTSLTTSILGTKYILFPIQTPPGYSAVLVVATHEYKADITLTFRLEEEVTFGNRRFQNGDSLVFRLDEFQTLTFREELNLNFSVSVAITSSQTIAVFAGLFDSNGTIAFYEQLPPVQQYVNEYLVSVDDNGPYMLYVVSEYIKAPLTVDKLYTVLIDDVGVYRQPMSSNRTLHIQSVAPIMAMLCQTRFNFVRCLIVPPFALYTNETSFPVFESGVVKIQIPKMSSDSELNCNSATNFPIQWKEISNSSYKVGTAVLPVGFCTMTSSTRFALLVFGDKVMYSGSFLFVEVLGRLSF